MAAGDGKRLKSDLPKVLHAVSGRPLLAHVLNTVAELDVAQTIVVASSRRAEIEAAMETCGSGSGIDYVIQQRPAGTADAVRVGLEAVRDGVEQILVVAGDAPLMTSATLRRMLETHVSSGASLTLLTAQQPDPTGYGRILRARDGSIVASVEERDATGEQRAIREVNAGAYVFDIERLRAVLPKVGADNVQAEHYVTDAIGLLAAEGDRIEPVLGDEAETRGVNSRGDLALIGALFRRRSAQRWMEEGISIVDPETTYIDASVTIERDAVILPFTFLEGETTVGAGAEIGPHARVIDSDIGPQALVSYAVVRGAVIGPEASVGPFASVRPGTKLGRGARLGTFVESKSTTIGEGSKANHLAYLGDAEIGARVNVGAGTITCNWDGSEKHTTVIDDDAYIGSDTMLVAPVHVGKRAATGAGSVVRDDVPDDALAVGVPAKVLRGKGDKMDRKPPSGSEDAGR